MARFNSQFCPSVAISGVSFGCYTLDEIQMLSAKIMNSSQSMDCTGHLVSGGVYDNALGPTIPNDICVTCNQNYIECPGHFGHIDLALPVFNPCFFSNLLTMKLINAGYTDIASELEQIFRTFCSNMNKNVDLGFSALPTNLLREFDKALENNGIASLQELNTAISSRNTCSKKMALIKWFEMRLRANKKFCTYCNCKLRSIRHELKFKIFFSDSSILKKKTVVTPNKQKNVSKSEYDEMEMENDDEKADGKEDGERHEDTSYFSPVDIMIHLDELWKKERDLFSLYLGFPEVKMGTDDKNPLCNLFLLRSILVTPSKFRPLLRVASQRFESGESTQYNRIQYHNDAIVNLLAGVENFNQLSSENKTVYKLLYNSWLSLQLSVNGLFEPPLTSKDPNQYRGLKNLIERKEGILRKNIMGKRVDFAGRSVISPDPFISTYEIGIPESFAKCLDFPENVNHWNYWKLRHLVLNGPDKYPGANFVKLDNGQVVRLLGNNISQRRAIANRLMVPEFGARKACKTVYRHLLSGDYVMVNRQPTLHRPSFMAHSARVLRNEKVLRLHYSNCKSYNADFDGDELNIHFPQNELSRAELGELMLNTNHYLVPKDGTPLGGLIHDHIVAAVSLTIKGQFLDKKDYQFLVMNSFENFNKKFKILQPAILKPKMLWSGKQVLSTILLNIVPDNQPLINLESNAKIPDKCWIKTEPREPNWRGTKDIENLMSESDVIVREGELLCGVLDKNNIGASLYGLTHCCQELYGGFFVNKLLSSLSRLFTMYFQLHGFTLGCEDILLTHKSNELRYHSISDSRLQDGKEALRTFSSVKTNDVEVLKNFYQKAHRNVDFCLMNELDVTYKSITDKFQTMLVNSMMKDGLLKKFPENNLQLMIISGAKGSSVNAMQLSCLLGQQELEGRRPSLMCCGSSLPSFEPYDLSPDACGFIYSSFLSGLSPSEYMFHCMAGREGLVDTAVKTSRSGYLQRCLIKHLEGLMVEYDMTVRDADGSVIQFNYGEDSLSTDKVAFLQKDKFKFLIDNFDLFANLPAYQFSMKKLTDSSRMKKLKSIYDWRKTVQKSYNTLKVRSSAFTSFSQCIKPEIDEKYGNRSVDYRSKKFIKCWQKLSPAEIIKFKNDVVVVAAPVQSLFFPGTCLEAISENLYDSILHFIKENKKKSSFPISKKDIKNLILYKSLVSIVQPGEAVGLIASQSVGEPSTQMTLNTFHFAGRGEMNVTLGIPRLREILMTAGENIKTPMMEVPIFPDAIAVKHALALQKRFNKVMFRDVIQKVTVKESVMFGDENGSSFDWFYTIHVDFFSKSDMTFQQILTSFEKKFVPCFTASIAKKLKEVLLSGLLRTVITKTKNVATHESGEETKKEDDDSDIEKPVEGESSKIRHDDEVDYEGEEEEMIDVGFFEESEFEEDEVDDEESKMAELSNPEDDTLQTNDQRLSLTKRRKTSMNDCRIRNVLSCNGMISDYRYDSENEKWCEIDLSLNAQYPRIDITSVIDAEAKKVAVRQVHGVKRCMLVDSPDNPNSKLLQTEGINFKEMLMYSNVLDLNRIYANNVVEMARTFGIEAANRVIIKEMVRVFSAYGININFRHLSLIADYMTFEGEYKPFTRQGLRSNPSAFQKMSFETAVPCLKEAVLQGQKETISSLSAKILIGAPSRIGTGAIDVLYRLNDQR